MTGTLRLIIIIFLVILALIPVLSMLLLSVRTGIEAGGTGGKGVYIDLRYGVLRIPILPSPQKMKKSETSQKPQKSKKKKEKKSKYKYMLNRDELDIMEIIELVFTLLRELGNTLNINRLRVRVIIATDDAAKTGVLLGYASAFTGIAVPFFENSFEMRDYNINIDADFDDEHTQWAFELFCSVRPIRIIFVILRHSLELFRLYKRLIKKVEAQAHE